MSVSQTLLAQALPVAQLVMCHLHRDVLLLATTDHVSCMCTQKYVMQALQVLQERTKTWLCICSGQLERQFPIFPSPVFVPSWQLQKEKLQWSPTWRYFWIQCLIWKNIQGIKKTYCNTEWNISSLAFVRAYRFQVNKSFIPVFCLRTDPIRVQTFLGLNKLCATNPNM